MSSPFANRVRKVQRELASIDGDAAMLLASAPEAVRSRDTNHPYRQNSDFFYLTGCYERDLLFLISTKERKPFLIARKEDPVKVLWDGKGESPSRLAAKMGAEVVITDDPQKEVLSRLKGIGTLFHQNISGSASWQIARKLIEMASDKRGSLPITFTHTDAVLEEMRLYKDASEIKLIKEAAAITNTALFGATQLMQKGNLEGDVAAMVDFGFRLHRAVPGFSTIVASGPSAATLHYEGGTRALRDGEMLLVDCGAEFEMYSADVTRVIPIGGAFQPGHREIYEIVLEAQKAAFNTIKHNVSVRAVYFAAAKVMTEGLKELKILSGRTSDLMRKEAFKKYFPHGIGHPLGLDVHDVGKIRGYQSTSLLKEGMVLTVEPGLYFPERVKKIAPCGVRIEDDVLVTARGCEILTEGFPKELDELQEAWE